jgi:DNA-repair protein complementing XP-A cells
MPKELKYCDFDFSKIKDSKGGFLIQEEAPEQKLIKTDVCEYCGSIDVNTSYFKYFQVQYCFSCIKEKDIQLLTKTESLKDYLLIESDLKSLKFMPKSNRHNKFTSMKLYLKPQVEKIALQKWKSFEELDKELDRRELESKERASKKFKKKLDELRKSTIVKNLVTQDHQHTMADLGNGKEKCETCDFVVEYEEFNF